MARVMERTLRTFPVLFAEKKYSPGFQSLPEFAKGWRTVLSRAHGGVAHCLCKPFTPELRKLSIKYTRSTDKYHLARFHGTESQHDTSCIFSQSYDGQTRGIDGGGDAVVNSYGEISISFHMGISTAKKTQSNSGDAPANAERKKRYTIKSLKLLRLIWEHAGLDVWHPSFAGKRNYFTAFYRIEQASHDIQVNGVPLSNILLLQTTDKNERTSGRNKETLEGAIASNRKLFVIAKLARYKPEQGGSYSGRLPIIGFSGMPWINVSSELWRRTEAAQQIAYEYWVKGGDVVAIALIEPDTARSASVLEVALMPVSDNLVPTD